MSDKVEKAYNKLKEKYKQLPDFKKVDFEFELSSVKDEDVNDKFISRLVKRRVFDKLHYFNGGMLTVLSPQAPSIIIAHENKFLTNKDREDILVVIKKFMCVERDYLISEVDFDEKRDVDVVMSSLDVWRECQPTVKRILTVMRDSWSKKDNFKVEDYIG
jgi:hypothetical protein